jgi:RHS repeat-associated protein
MKERYEYDAYGNVYNGKFGEESSYFGNGKPGGNVYGFTGQRFEKELGVYSFAFRDYDPGLMRWLEEDPLKDGLNWYAYCDGDPVNFVDPLGLCKKKTNTLWEQINDATGGFIAGATDALVNNFGGIGAGQNLNQKSPWYYAGKLAGDILSVYGGTAIAESGVTIVGGGIGLTSTGVGAPLGVAAIATGSAVTLYGANTMKNSLVNGITDARLFAESMFNGGRGSELNYKLKPQDLDWRGTGKTSKDALNEAFKKTGVSKEEFTVTKWGKDINGKSVPVEWRSKNGAEVSIDLAHNGSFKNGEWQTGPDAPHVGWQTAGKKNTVGHIILDNVPAGR